MKQSPAIRILCILAACLLAGCDGPTASPFKGLSPEQSRQLAKNLANARDAELQEDLQSAFADRPPRNILLLSNGGPHGAFACGVLAGWRDAPTTRPQFDLVTGVSTGALMATFAFLGQPGDDAVLKQVYTQSRDRDIYDGFFTTEPNSIYDTEPLRKLIARHITNSVIDRVADAHRQGRRLYIATVSLDEGAVVIWPMSRIAAAGGPDRYNRFRQIVLAAAAIPLVFPPVEIDGNLHVDAGLRECIFLRDAMLGQPAADSPGNVYAIISGKLGRPPQAIPNDLVHIGDRAIDLYIDALLLFNLRETAHVALSHNPPFLFHYIAEPQDLAVKPDPGLFTAMFDPKDMSNQYIAGEALGRAGMASWENGLPEIDADPAATQPITEFSKP